MITHQNYIKQLLSFSFAIVLTVFSFSLMLSAKEIKWLEVSKTNNEVIFIDPSSINYDNRGFLSVITKQSEIDPEDQEILNTDSYLMAIDCDNRLYSRLPITGDIKQVKNWETPLNDKLIKKTIINSCSY
tara:strand:+ start:100 stop:489 length:390 start_codon:yes stop_codon:yes gene_type:complete